MLFVRLNQGIGPHQAALADAMYNLLGDNFVFIEFGRERQFQTGSYTGMSQGVDYYANRPFVLRMKDSQETSKYAKELINKADVLHTGGEPLELTAERILAGKLTFRSAERIFKKPFLKNPRLLRSMYNLYYRLSTPNYRVLCQSAYMANDLAICHKGYKDKCYKFAYYTQIPTLDVDNLINKKEKNKLQIVWCARFIDWKHPELPVLLARKLVDSGRYDFEIQMIGADTTQLWKKTKDLVMEKEVQGNVILSGGLSNNEVLERMRQSHIFIFTSDRQEGWGAVLNEAMGAGCACVASHDIGSVPFLINNNENGLIYKSCSVDSLFEKVAQLYDNRALCDKLGKAAYCTITTDWSAQLAAERLVQLSESILTGNEISFNDGPCSKAKPITFKSIFK